MIRIHNITTDEVIDREMDDAEFAKWEANKLENEIRAEIADKAAEARIAVLEKLGITEAEAKLILG